MAQSGKTPPTSSTCETVVRNNTHQQDVVQLEVRGADDYDTYERKPQAFCAKRGSRLTALFVGLVSLAVVGLTLFLVLDPVKGGSQQQQSSENFVGDISTAQLMEHGTADDCWLAIFGNVYQLASYAPTHPGGSAWITDNCATDATDEYSRFHPEELLQTIPWTLVGSFIGDQAATSSNTPGTSPGTGQLESSSSSSSDEEEGTAPAPLAAPVAAPAPVEAGCISSSAVATHNTSSDCHTIFYGQVYDMTNYINSHPGGSNDILNGCGSDRTTAFSRVQNHNQALLARDVSQYIIGSVC